MKTADNNQANPSITSGKNLSFWLNSVEPIKFSPLNHDYEQEVVVVGAGISGLSVAYNLLKAGKKVIVIEDGYIASGETGRTTAHLVNALDDFYTDIEKYHGEEGARLAAESHTEAINFIERVTREEGIECDFKRLDGYLFLHPSDKHETLQKEHEATNKAGVKTILLDQTPGLAADDVPCLHYPNQAQFHILKYIKGLTDAIVKMGGEIYTETHVTNIKEGELKANGFTVKADTIVVATNTPINDLVTMHTKQWPYRTYVIGVKVPKNSVEHRLWWDTGDQDSKWVSKPYKYIRLQEMDEQNDLLICGGEDHKTGQADDEGISEEDRYTVLIEWVKQNFPAATELVYKWSGQVMEPLDSMAYIGKNPGDKNVYIVTGDSGNGMTHGTIAGMLLKDLITGKENAWAKLYDPSRISLKVTGDYLKEAGNMTAQYADLVSGGDVDSAAEIGRGQGAILTKNLKKIAVYRDDEGTLHSYSAICPHLGCVVQWNAEEKSFDCPCHGSRFTCKGEVINGPASSDLSKAEIKE
ncbi:FAD-dependent oxidoreductase [Paradesertivirga mongoliensis]|uniref:FAD-dependent oxidoreductase n=1 Tax=Paradesertivirga mongoliensis TaxID=2100740 RepID=A0ABW4ZMH9_9SPHI|nr:FAD-dependent oxidoreductase [Pedobacter mongoliensis]